MEFGVETMTVDIFQACILKGSAANILDSVLAHGGFGIEIHFFRGLEGNDRFDANGFVDLSPEGTEAFTVFFHGLDGIFRLADKVFSVLQLQDVNGGGRHTLQ